MKKVNISKIISDLIIKQKIKVIGVMYVSKVDTKDIPFAKLTNEQIFDILINELPINEDLRINLGSLIDQEFDLTALNTVENKSNAWGTSTPSTFGSGTSSTTPKQGTAAGNALRDNAGNLIMSGVDILKNWFSPKQQPIGTTGGAGGGAGSGTSDAILLQMQMQQQTAAQQAAAQAAADKASSRNTMLIVGVIGGLVVVGGIVAIVLTRK